MGRGAGVPRSPRPPISAPQGSAAEPEQGLRARAIDLIHAGDGETAERLLNEALAIEPDSPVLLNNLASAYFSQGRQAEGERIIRDIHRRFPDYLFGQANMAILHGRRGEFEEARALLEPILLRRKLHFSELAALAGAEIELALAQGQRESARTWLALWEQAEADHPRIPVFKERVEKGGLLSRWFAR